MASYTPTQYAAQRRVMAVIVRALNTRRCPECGQPAGVWPDGVQRITCGREACYRRWLGSKGKEKTHETTTYPDERVG